MRYGQSRRMSLVESVFNVIIGFGIAVATQVVVFPWFGIHIPLSTNVVMAVPFTVISILRSYLLRRFFNWLHVRIN